MNEENIANLAESHESDKKIKALIIHSSSNEKILKGIRMIKKVFGSQLKLLFLKEREYEEISGNTLSFEINHEISVYKVGLEVTRGEREKQLANIKSIFILAMHPELK